MKKIFNIFVLVAAAAMALVSCNKQEVEAPKPQEFEYTFEIAGDTKATIGEDCVVWESGDKIGVYTDGQNGISYNRYGNITLGSPVTFKVSSYYALVAGDMVHCYYPYVDYNSQNPKTVELSIPTSQTEKNQMPMVSLPYAVTENLAAQTNSEKSAGEIRFANLGSVIEFHVYSTAEAYQTELVKSVTFNADQAIAGDFTFDLTAVDYSNEETLAIAGYEATSVVSTLSTSTQVSADKDAATVVKMVVAPGSYTGNIVVTTDKATYTYPISTAKSFKRSGVQPLGLNLRDNVRQENTSSEPVEVVATLTFDDKAKRTEYSTDIQVWEENGIKLTNNKASSTNDVADYAKPARFYANSSIVIEAPGNITKLVFDCNESSYATAIKNSIGTTATASSDKVTVLISSPDETFTIAKLTAQARVDAVTVTYVTGGASETPDQPEGVTLSSIMVSDDAKTEYTVGDAFVKPVVTATYSDSSTKDVTAEFSGYDMDAAGTYTVNVSYTEKEVTATDSYEIVVKAKEDAEIVAHTVTWNLAKDETSEASASNLAWDADGVSMVNSKGAAQSDANNYYPGVDNRTSTRFYSGNSLEISPKTGYAINSVVFTATTEGYANALKNCTWSNASAIVSGTTVTINPEDGREDILASITGTCGFTKVVVDLVPSEGYVKPVVVLSSIALSGQTTNYTVGDTFSFTGTITATYSNGATKTVAPTEAEVSSPDMLTAGDKEVTVTYTEGGETVTAKYTISVAEKSTEPEEPSSTPKFVKVTSAPSDWSGTYLIVYETGKVAFDGSLTTLDAASNTKSVTITNGEIEATDAMMAITFDIAKNGTVYTIKSKSGYYIGNNSDSNSLTSNKSTKYDNTITLNTDKSVQIVGKGKSVLRYNATSGQTRFRYFKSSTYTNQKAIHLYKLDN